MKLRTWLTLLRTPHMWSALQLLRDLQPFLRIHFLFAAFELGLLKALQEPATKENLQARLGIRRSELFESLLAMGVALGELGCDHGRYTLKGNRARALAARDGDPLAAFVQEHIVYHGSVYRHLAERLRGEPLGNYLEDTGDLIARSSRVMEPFLATFVRQLVGARRPRRILEIGCGSGIYLKYAAEAYPALTGVAIDLQPQVAERAKKNLATWGLGDRFQICAGDIRHPPAEAAGPFDLITLYNNVYYFTPDERRALFQTLYARLEEGGALALVSPMHGNEVETVNFDIVLQSTRGCTRLQSQNELIEELATTGFRRIKVEQLGPGEILTGVVAHK